MNKNLLNLLIFLFTETAVGQSFDKQKELSSNQYQNFKSEVIASLGNIQPGKFGEFIPGIKTKISSNKKVLAFTFDACGGPHGSGFDRALIDFLKKEKIHATLFVTGLWIEKNLDEFQSLCREPLFEIENHGLTHHPCTIGKESKYGIKGTGSVSAGFDEIELNARQIEFYAHRKPRYYRPATAATDEACVSIAMELKETIVGYSVLSGDAVPRLPLDEIKKTILRTAKPGAIVIMHMNHPEWNGFEALQSVIPSLRQQGYEFVTLDEGFHLTTKP